LIPESGSGGVVQRKSPAARFSLAVLGVVLLTSVCFALADANNEKSSMSQALLMAIGAMTVLCGAVFLTVYGMITAAEAADVNNNIKSFHKFFGVEVPQSDEERGVLQAHIEVCLCALRTEFRAACEMEAQLLAQPKEGGSEKHASALPAVQLAMLRQAKEHVKEKKDDFYFAHHLAGKAGFDVKTAKEFLNA
jgi:hypothetical protein